MQHSSVLLPTLTTLPGLEPASGSAGRRTFEEGDTGQGFAALLAAAHVPAGGEALPAGGKVLPPGAAAPTLDGAAKGGTLPLPSDAAVLEHRLGAGSTRVRIAPPPAPGGIDASLDLPGRAIEATIPAATAAVRLADAAVGAPGSASPGVGAGGRAATSAPMVEAAAETVAPAVASAPPADARAAATMSTMPTLSTGPAIPAERVEAPPVEHRALEARRGESDLRAALDAGRDDGELAPDSRASEGGSASADDAVALRIAARAGVATPAADPPAPPSVLAGPAAAGAAPADIQSGAAIRPQSAPHDPGAARAPGELGDAVAGRVRLMVDQGAGEARLRLDPPELGTIDVRITVVDDKTFVQLTASHAAGRDALEQSLPRLRELLAAGGLDVGGTSVDGGGRGTSSGYAPGGAADAYALAEVADPAVDVPPSRGDRPVGSTSRVDLYA